MMDLPATVCTPRKPGCEMCPAGGAAARAVSDAVAEPGLQPRRMDQYGPLRMLLRARRMAKCYWNAGRQPEFGRLWSFPNVRWGATSWTGARID